jgi:hypothetical protein
MGPTGYTGYTGPTGYTGYTGPTGYTGYTGPNGSAGSGLYYYYFQSLGGGSNIVFDLGNISGTWTTYTSSGVSSDNWTVNEAGSIQTNSYAITTNSNVQGNVYIRLPTPGQGFVFLNIIPVLNGQDTNANPIYVKLYQGTASGYGDATLSLTSGTPLNVYYDAGNANSWLYWNGSTLSNV